MVSAPEMMPEPAPNTPGCWLDSEAVPSLVTSFIMKSADDSSKTLLLDKSQPPTPDGTGRPVNFGTIGPGLYRSSYPQFAHLDVLSDIQLKTIITLVPDALPIDYANFISSNGIIHHHIPIIPNKDPELYTPDETVLRVLSLMFDPANYPLLVHCNKGKHRTGCVTACFRKVTGWSLQASVREYEAYSKPKDRELDKRFIERFEPPEWLKALALERGYIGGVYREPVQESSSASVYTARTYDTATTDDELPYNDYQDRAKKENDAMMESFRMWSHR